MGDARLAAAGDLLFRRAAGKPDREADTATVQHAARVLLGLPPVAVPCSELRDGVLRFPRGRQ